MQKIRVCIQAHPANEIIISDQWALVEPNQKHYNLTSPIHSPIGIPLSNGRTRFGQLDMNPKLQASLIMQMGMLRHG